MSSIPKDIRLEDLDDQRRPNAHQAHFLVLARCAAEPSRSYAQHRQAVRAEVLDRDQPLPSVLNTDALLHERITRDAAKTGRTYRECYDAVAAEQRFISVAQAPTIKRVREIARDVAAQATASKRDRLGAGAHQFRSTIGGAALFTSHSGISRVFSAEGDNALSEQETMRRINALQPAGSVPLTRDRVYIHSMEAVNTLFIEDRFGFMGVTTVQNTASAARRGEIAFMNSHRTGGDLPYGRSFAGRFENVAGADGKQRVRAVIQVYMIKGARPNGPNAPSTDDVHVAISGGTVFDVSIGIPRNSGTHLCDVCSNDLLGEACNHWPGRAKNMTKEEMKKQEARGIPGGMATYTLAGGTPHEVSAVYSGAVPAAGFTASAARGRAA